ncbi:hypothetical protein EsDP_00006601 [Epichloe bromicola]|uniref:Protein kinase domain-containing protein n=1 Tax=Epichloe bromicola TaxID=79588 RepID=A0ABQ0CY52_9HYPO
MSREWNVFAILTARDQKNKASSAFRLKHNSKWLCIATGGVAETPIIESREATPAEDSHDEYEEQGAVDRLIVTFDECWKNSLTGLQFGTHPISSHVLLGHRGTKGISSRQYNITVDSELRIWLQDYHSTHGTAVGYDGQNQKDVRRKETWILAYEPGSRKRFNEISIHTGGLAIKVDFPNHSARGPRYVDNLKAFFHKSSDIARQVDVGDPPIEGLDLESAATTQAPSIVQTPRDKLVYYNDKLVGRGTFGAVHRAIRARDGKYVAAKTFTKPANKRNLDDVDPAWLTGIRREFTVMKDNPHANIVQVFDFHEMPEPMIIMAYYSLGNIADVAAISEDDYVTAFGQVLDGLSHLHAQGVVHRDLKPENLLVEKEPFFKVVITDFGMAKVVNKTTLLTTFCGTLKYAAPEVFPGITEGHGPPVDVWSLGVIGLEWLHHIPAPPDVPDSQHSHVPSREWHLWIREWSDMLRDRLEDEDDDKVIEILHRMIYVDASRRWPAKRCLAQGFNNDIFQRRVVDGLVVCTSNPGSLQFLATKTPSGSASPQSPGSDLDATIVLGNLQDEEGCSI